MDMLTTIAVGMLAQAFPTGLVSLAVVFFVVALLAYAVGAKGMAGMRPAGLGRRYFMFFWFWR